MTDTTDTSAIELATDLTIAWLGNANTRAASEDVPAFLEKMHATVSALQGVTQPEPEPAPAEEHVPAITARKSLASRDHIISMIDGKPYRTLRRHLSTHGLTAEQYRERYKLPATYPMVASAYSETRSEMARKIGLGRKAGSTAKKRGRAAKSVDKPAAE